MTIKIDFNKHNNIFFTSDHHFGHKNIIKYCNRPFSSVGEMNDFLIKRWNEVVEEDDLVFHLGDFTLGGYEYFCKYIFSLNGQINIVPGGHDGKWLKFLRSNINTLKSEYFANLKKLKILYPLVTLEIKNFIKDPVNKYPLVIVLCHYAMRVWDRSHYGSWNLYGHSHGNLTEIRNSLDVGVDNHDFYPISLKEVEKLISKS